MPALALWSWLIECSGQSSLNSLEFTFLAEILELSDFDFFNGIRPQADPTSIFGFRLASAKRRLSSRRLWSGGHGVVDSARCAGAGIIIAPVRASY